MGRFTRPCQPGPQRLCLASVLLLLVLRSGHCQQDGAPNPSKAPAEMSRPTDGMDPVNLLDSAIPASGEHGRLWEGVDAPVPTSFLATYKAPLTAICLNVVGTLVVWLHKSQRLKLVMMLHLAVA
mmetsp:Transcript_60494/g.112314  ORF Transcript_60494/g.112314 Transcript_60494/m.112314 type:complete len:125 (+) Transcript_60494:55-429(+)